MIEVEIVEHVLCLLREQGAKPRAYIEATLKFKHGVTPVLLGRVMQTMISTARMFRTAIPTKFNGIVTDVYSLERLSDAELRYLEARLESKYRTLNPGVLRESGEYYFRGLLIRAGVFRSISQRNDLGKVRIVGGGRHTADLSFAAAGSAAIAEVKNRRECFSSSSNVFPVLLTKAVAADATPVFAAAHLSEEAKERCKAIGIAVLEFERQFLPKPYRARIEALRDVIGPAPYEFIGKRFYQNEEQLPRLALENLGTVTDPRWLFDAAAKWKTNREVFWKNIPRGWLSTRPLLR